MKLREGSLKAHIGADLLRRAHGMDPPLSWVFVAVSSEPSPATTRHSQPRAEFVTGPQYSLNTLHHCSHLTGGVETHHK